MMHSDTLELEKVEPEARACRFYRAALWGDLFGGVALMREWGRIGRPGQLRLDPYPDAEQARAALNKLRRAKHRKGYREVV